MLHNTFRNDNEDPSSLSERLSQLGRYDEEEAPSLEDYSSHIRPADYTRYSTAPAREEPAEPAPMSKREQQIRQWHQGARFEQRASHQAVRRWLITGVVILLAVAVLVLVAWMYSHAVRSWSVNMAIEPIGYTALGQPVYHRDSQVIKPAETVLVHDNVMECEAVVKHGKCYPVIKIAFEGEDGRWYDNPETRLEQAQPAQPIQPDAVTTQPLDLGTILFRVGIGLLVALLLTLGILLLARALRRNHED